MTTNRKKFEVGKSYGSYYFSDYFNEERLCYILTVVKRTEKTLWFTVQHSDETTYSDYDGINKRKIQTHYNDFEQVTIHQGYTDFRATDEIEVLEKGA